jgi:hypothetical protein
MRFDHGSTAATTDEGGLRRIQEFHIGTFVLVLEPGRNFVFARHVAEENLLPAMRAATRSFVSVRTPPRSRFGAGISSARIGREKGISRSPGPCSESDPCAKMCSTRLEFPRGWEESFSTRTACMQGMASTQVHAALLETSVCCERSRVVVYRRRSFEPSF